MRRPLPTLCAAATLAISAGAARGFAHAQVGTLIEDVTMTTLDGKKEHLLGDADVNVFLFFRPAQENSRQVLKQVATLEQEMAAKPVRWVAIVSSSVPAADVAGEVKEFGLRMPVLIDKDDGLYGKLGVALHPVVGITGKDHKLIAYQPFSKLQFEVNLRARIRHALGEISGEELSRVLEPPRATQGGNTVEARRYVKLAEAFLKSKKWDKALGEAQKAIEKDAALADGHAAAGAALAGMQKCAEARAEIDQALAIDPRNALALESQKGCPATGRPAGRRE